MASLFIRCDEEVWLMARALAKNENRSVTKPVSYTHLTLPTSDLV